MHVNISCLSMGNIIIFTEIGGFLLDKGYAMPLSGSGITCAVGDRGWFDVSPFISMDISEWAAMLL